MNAFVVAALFLVLGIAHAFDEATPFIVGGQLDAAKGKGSWPWQLSLQHDRNKEGRFGHTCGAVLIDSMHALCAAHCFMMADAASTDVPYYKLYAGAFDLSKGDAEQVLTIHDWVMHPDFSAYKPGMPHNIAMIRFNEPADLSNPNIQAIEMAEDTDTFAGNTNCWITGWGRTSKESQASSPILKELNLPVLTNQECTKRWRRAGVVGWLHPIMDVHICVGYESGKKSACQGDSGGPMVCKTNSKFVLTGITSRGWPDCEMYPSVYTRVSKYLNWANSEVAKL